MIYDITEYGMSSFAIYLIQTKKLTEVCYVSDPTTKKVMEEFYNDDPEFETFQFAYAESKDRKIFVLK